MLIDAHVLLLNFESPAIMSGCEARDSSSTASLRVCWTLLLCKFERCHRLPRTTQFFGVRRVGLRPVLRLCEPVPLSLPRSLWQSHIASLRAGCKSALHCIADSMKLLALALLGCLALARAAADDPTVSLPGVTDLSEFEAGDPPAHSVKSLRQPAIEAPDSLLMAVSSFGFPRAHFSPGQLRFGA